MSGEPPRLYWKQKPFTRREIVILLLGIGISGIITGVPFGYYWASTHYPQSTSRTIVVVSVPQLNATLSVVNATASHTLNATRFWLRFDVSGGRPFMVHGVAKYLIAVESDAAFVFLDPAWWATRGTALEPSGFTTSFLVWGQTGNVTLRFLVNDRADGVFCALSDLDCQAAHYSGQLVPLEKTIVWGA